MKTSPISNLLGALARSAPLLAALTLLGMPMLLAQSRPDQSSIQQRHTEVARAVADVPWRIGNYMGEDVAMPSAAVEILRPNATLSRQFRKSGGPAYTLLVIHCTDARDMQGHYPPKCYPSNGWVNDPLRSESVCQVDVQGKPLDMRVYHYQRLEGVGIHRRMRVFNCFVLPDGRIASDVSAVADAVGRYATSVRGIGQVQVVCPSDVDFEQSRKAVGELLSGVSSLIDVLGGASLKGEQST